MNAPRPAIHVDSLKMAREALCAAEHAMLHTLHDPQRVATIAAMIADIDEQRPLGPDGKHGDRHTPTCGCKPVPMTQEEKIAYRLAWDARVEEGKRKKADG